MDSYKFESHTNYASHLSLYRTMSRTCRKCRLHGVVQLLKGHKRNCPFENCCCPKCASHDNLLTLRVDAHHASADKGKLWRANLAKSSSVSLCSSAVQPVQFPDLTSNSQLVKDTSFAFELANYETAKKEVEKRAPKAEQRQAKQQDQLAKHRNLYNSINSYSQEIGATAKDLNPVTVLKTAIQLHQRQPKNNLDATSTFTASTFSPTMANQGQQFPAQHFNEQLDNLKKVLPFASEVQLASRLAQAQGDVDLVVGEILDSTPEMKHEDEAENMSIIDLTTLQDEEKAENSTASSLKLEMTKLASVPVETDDLRRILKTVEENEAEKECNLYSFNKPERNVRDMNVLASLEPNERSQSLSSFEVAQCPYCSFKCESFEQGFCKSCGGVIPRNYRW